MRRTVTLVTAPTAEPLTLAEAKLWAKIDGTDEDPQLATLLTAAIQAAEQYLRRKLITQTLKASLDLSCGSLDSRLGEGVYDLPRTALFGALPTIINLPNGPVQSITSVTTYDITNASSAYSSTNYTLSNDRMVLNYGAIWPSNMRQFGATEILYVVGYGDTGSSVPQPIKQAILMHFASMYETRNICELPVNCMFLLNQYRIMDNA